MVSDIQSLKEQIPENEALKNELSEVQGDVSESIGLGASVVSSIESLNGWSWEKDLPPIIVNIILVSATIWSSCMVKKSNEAQAAQNRAFQEISDSQLEVSQAQLNNYEDESARSEKIFETGFVPVLELTSVGNQYITYRKGEFNFQNGGQSLKISNDSKSVAINSYLFIKDDSGFKKIILESLGEDNAINRYVEDQYYLGVVSDKKIIPMYENIKNTLFEQLKRILREFSSNETILPGQAREAYALAAGIQIPTMTLNEHFKELLENNIYIPMHFNFNNMFGDNYKIEFDIKLNIKKLSLSDGDSEPPMTIPFEEITLSLELDFISELKLIEKNNKEKLFEKNKY
jgi:hypothetical protein